MTKLISRTLKHRLIFLESSQGDDFSIAKWSPKFVLYGEINPLRNTSFNSLEPFNFGNIITSLYFIITIRYHKEVHHKMRIQFQTRIFDIKKISNHKEENIMLNILAYELLEG